MCKNKTSTPKKNDNGLIISVKILIVGKILYYKHSLLSSNGMFTLTVGLAT